MPVQMWHDIAKAGQVDLGRLQMVAQHLLHRINRCHQAMPRRQRQVGHLAVMGIQNHAAKARVVGIVHQHHATKIIAPQQLAALFLAQGAVILLGIVVGHRV